MMLLRRRQRARSEAPLAAPQIPAEVLDAVRGITGPVDQVLAAGLCEPGAGTVVIGASGTFLVKSVPCDVTDGPCGVHGACILHERERDAVMILPSAVPAPRLRLSSRSGPYRIALYEYVAGEGANLSPGSADLPEVLGLAETIGRQEAPRGLPLAGRLLETMRQQACSMVPRMPLADQAMYIDALGGYDPGQFDGASLVHLGLGPDSLMMTRGGLRVTGWERGCSGPPWLPAALLVPPLILAGHRAGAAQDVLSAIPCWKSAPQSAVTALAAGWALQQAWLELRSSVEEQRQAAARAALAGREWLLHRYGLGHAS